MIDFMNFACLVCYFITRQKCYSAVMMDNDSSYSAGTVSY